MGIAWCGSRWRTDVCQLQPSTDWDSTINQLQSLARLQSLGGNKDLRRLTILAFQATTYWLWNEETQDSINKLSVLQIR
ncbi:hypothetical protein Bca52824_042120 [Brassica carinata]|uniref:Uncharacterized protein n=1 Tax=Brassica carinata TaxID=52824 RepID=A0A8X7RWL9_BRACI|nr:hypothetical protein Bca52824_042120 [Brassica carinata]